MFFQTGLGGLASFRFFEEESCECDGLDPSLDRAACFFKSLRLNVTHKESWDRSFILERLVYGNLASIFSSSRKGVRSIDLVGVPYHGRHFTCVFDESL